MNVYNSFEGNDGDEELGLPLLCVGICQYWIWRPTVRLRFKCDGTRAENRFRPSAKRTSPFKSAGASVQSTTGSRCLRISGCRLRLKCDGTRAETRFRLSAKRTSPFKSGGGGSIQATGSRGVRLSGRNAGYTMLRGSVKGTGYPLHSLVSPSLPLPTSPCAITFQLDFLLRIVFHGLGVLSLVFLTDFSCLYVVYSTLLNVIGAVDRSRP
jgi:hypothetical protein